MREAINLAVIENKKLLLVKKKDVWILPGGKPEKDEGDLECLAREIGEELQSQIKVNSYYSYFEGITPHKRDALKSKVYFGILVEEFYPSNEISDARFVSDFDNYSLSDITKLIIKSLKKNGYL